MKLLIFVFITVGGLVGGWLGTKLDGGFGIWSILFGGLVGPIIGIYVGYKIADTWLE